MEKTSEQKYQATKKAIVILLRACGPCEMSEIVREVKAQAYPAYIAKAISDLMLALTIKFDVEEQCYEIR